MFLGGLRRKFPVDEVEAKVRVENAGAGVVLEVLAVRRLTASSQVHGFNFWNNDQAVTTPAFICPNSRVMLSRSLRRAVLDTRIQLPPAFLLPWIAHLSTVSHTTEAGNAPDQLVNSASKTSSEKSNRINSSNLQTQPVSQSSQPLPPPSSQTSPITLSQSIRDLLPILQSQSPHYITCLLYTSPSPRD